MRRKQPMRKRRTRRPAGLHVLSELAAWLDCCHRDNSGMAGVQKDEQSLLTRGGQSPRAEREADGRGAVLCGGHWGYQEL